MFASSGLEMLVSILTTYGDTRADEVLQIQGQYHPDSANKMRTFNMLSDGSRVLGQTRLNNEVEEVGRDCRAVEKVRNTSWNTSSQ